MRFRVARAWVVVGAMLLVAARLKGAPDPFTVSFEELGSGEGPGVRVRVLVPPGYHLYSDQVQAYAGDSETPLARTGGDRPVTLLDRFSGSSLASFTNDFTLEYGLPETVAPGSVFRLAYQGCSESACFFPATREFRLSAVPAAQVASNMAGREAGLAPPGSGTPGGGWAAGYLGRDEFLAFLDRVEGRPAMAQAGWSGVARAFTGDPAGFLKAHGAFWTLLLILVGGLLLNLTPCILPMIPVNLAILGVGARDQSRSRGFMLGAAYGAGMMLVYGGLGLVVVLTGAQFGTLNSMPWFNGAMGLLFAALGLAMFDLFSIDFTRFQGRGADPEKRRTGLLPAVVAGGLSALLAGACVAPVVIAVLLLAGKIYAQGGAFGLALPFVLGLGMALPWPLAGAGLTFLPRPGAWMIRIKHGFGVFILVLALYFAYLAYQGWHGPSRATPQPSEGMLSLSARDRDWRPRLEALRSDGKPVLIDFWATWCKNCEAMELTTFRDPEVKARLEGYHVVKFQLEELASPAARGVAELFEVKGLPTYIVLGAGARR